MHDTRDHSTPTPRLSAQWQRTDDRRLTMTWTAQPSVASDEHEGELALAS
jgi:hypothetical protein